MEKDSSRLKRIFQPEILIIAVLAILGAILVYFVTNRESDICIRENKLWDCTGLYSEQTICHTSSGDVVCTIQRQPKYWCE